MVLCDWLLSGSATVSWYHPSLFSVLLVVSFLKDVKGRILVCTDVYLNMVGSPGFVFVVAVVNGNAVSWGDTHTHPYSYT